MKVTLDVFSGRENPSFYLSDKDAQSLIERVANKSVLRDVEHQSQLGFSGFKIEPTSDDQLPEGIPESFYIGTALAAGVSGNGRKHPLLSTAETNETFNFLL